MSNSNQFYMKNLLFSARSNPWEQHSAVDSNATPNHKISYDLSSNDNIKEYSLPNMIIEPPDKLSKSHAFEFLQLTSSIESKSSSSDVMKDIEEDELVSSNNRESFAYDNLSHLSLLIPQQRSSHVITSFNNAAQSTKLTSNTNKRSSLLRSLFKRNSSKQSTYVVKQPIQNVQSRNKRRSISGGDHVKISLAKEIHVEHSFQAKHSSAMNIQGDISTNQENNNNQMQLPLQGLRYDFKDIKSISTTINSSEVQNPSKDSAISVPFISRLSNIKEKSLSSLPDSTLLYQNTNEQKQHIQSAHTVGSIPKIKAAHSSLEKISFNANQHKFYVQTPNYHYPKRLSTIKMLAKQYSLPATARNTTGLFWFNANQQAVKALSSGQTIALSSPHILLLVETPHRRLVTVLKQLQTVHLRIRQVHQQIPRVKAIANLVRPVEHQALNPNNQQRKSLMILPTKFVLVALDIMSERGRARGRGRSRPVVPGEPSSEPSGAAGITAPTSETPTESVTTSSAPTPTVPSASDTPTSEWSTTETAPTVQQSAIRRIGGGGTMSIPRGRGLDKLAPHMAGMSIGEHREGRSRGPPIHDDSQRRSVDPTRVNFREPGSEKQGTSGELIPLIANYVRILSAPQWLLYQYHVTFIPDSIDSRKTRRELLAQHKGVLQDVAFDGQTLYSFNDLGDDYETKSFHEAIGQDITMQLHKVAVQGPESPNFFHLSNLIMRKLLELAGMRMIGRSYYQFDKKVDIDRFSLTLFPGFETAINVYEGVLMMNVDLSHKVINNVSIYQRLQNIFAQFQEYKLAQDTAMRELVGQIVITTYNHKTYKVDDIAWDKTPQITFAKRDGTEMSLIDYYQERYQLQIVDHTQPLLVSKPSRQNRRAGITGPILLIPEFCRETGISDSMRNDFNLMKELASHTHIEPTPRYQSLMDMVNTINTAPRCRQYMSKWNLRLDDNLVELEARTLEPETINYSDRSVRYKQQEADWSRDGRSCRHLKPGHLDKWLVVYEGKQKPIANELINTLYNVCTPMGMRVEYPEIAELQNDRPETYLKALEQYCLNQQYNLVLCVLSNNRKDRYDALKKFLCMDTAVPSQMVLLKTLNKRGQLMSVATKIGIQISAKLGGEIWSVPIPSKSLMVIGIDSYHDKKRKQVSVAAFVATTNPQCTSYYSRIVMQTTTQELVDGISVCIRDALKAFFMQNNAMPERIVIYRDGVGDGQLQAVYEHELPQIEETFNKVQEGYAPKWAMIIVKKRGCSRFFAKNSHQLYNPPPGTIIDHTITHQNWFDFYLISQCARQGTAAPTHFNVIWDRTTFKVDHIQRLTFKLCHLYYNWPGTIRVPMVCQYAHKLSYLVGQSLHQDFNHDLSNKLFYL
ncbi:unnamed protein product [Rotaria magnacalcarata]|uniref:Uncharacterized protein n=1 Tax=Rotaria magnacalcarata TaxID=392030 RepID=A0A816ZQR9_9BILA|nr:unnamed protein product [Rotaria magnacalcarata]